MEKIYENKPKTRKNYFNKRNVTTGITLGVALIAIISVLALSLSRSSYALDEVKQLPDKILTSQASYYLTGDHGATFSIRPYSDATSGAKLFCLESGVDFLTGVEMSKGLEISDKGLIYLSSKLEQLTFSTSDFTGVTEEQIGNIESWVKQNAYWVYLAEIGAEKSSSEYAETIAAVKAETTIHTDTAGFTSFPAGNTTPLFEKYGINGFIEQAKKYHSSADPILKVSVNKASEAWTKNSGNYRSGKITVGFYGDKGFNGLIEAPTTYSMTLTGAPSGTKVMAVNKKTNKEEDVTSKLTNLAVDTYTDFYLVVPEGSVQKNTKYSITLSAKGDFKKYTGYYYEGSKDGKAAQRVTTIAITNSSQVGGTDLELTIAADTALDVSQSIYFIGLIVLLSGLGILYANVKKQKEY